MANNTTESFVDYIWKFSHSGFEETSLKAARLCLLDYVGVTLAGVKMAGNKTKRILGYFSETNMSGKGPVVGLDQKTDMLTAALLNGIHSHYAELDDGDRYGMIHPGVSVISSLIAVSGREKMTTEQLLKGIVTGYEAGILLARKMQPSLKLNGWHATGVVGGLAGAIAIGSALKFDKNKLKNAISAAVAQTSGMLAVIRDGSELKPLNAGRAAQNAINAIGVANADMKGPNDVLGSEKGLFAMMGAGSKLDGLQFKGQEKPLIHSIYRKPYASCRHCHPAVEAALLIQSENSFELDDIQSVRIKTYGLGIPGHEHREINGVNSAKMSTPYSVASALVLGNGGLGAFSERMIASAEVLSLTNKVYLVEDPELSGLVPEKRAAVVEIELESGKLVKIVELPKGEPENPMTEKEVIEKFGSLAAFAGLSAVQSQKIREMILEREIDVNELCQDAALNILTNMEG